MRCTSKQTSTPCPNLCRLTHSPCPCPTLSLYSTYVSHITPIRTSIAASKTTIHKLQTQYASLIPQITAVLLSAKADNDEEKAQEVLWRLGVETMNHEEAVAKENERIEELEEEARGLRRGYEVAVLVRRGKIAG
ncbi:hypothetical protein G7Y79_00069g096320 [Physcia stellaris]|nr:hypothetical protein G7Y79_00069g096320 [Physcia stellaris]